jgi:hypothetical protein
MADQLQDITGPPGTKYTWQQLPDAIKALQNGDDVDFVGAAGEIDLDDNGDPEKGVRRLSDQERRLRRAPPGRRHRRKSSSRQ